MRKELPKPKKSLKSFILDEDAKVIDKTATKVAITASFLAINFLANSSDANAKGHSNHSNHQNNVNAPDDYGTGIHGGNNPTGLEVNEIDGKEVETWHSNHYNHGDASGGESGLGMILGAVVAAVAIAFTGPGGMAALSSFGGSTLGSMGVSVMGFDISAGALAAVAAGAVTGGVVLGDHGDITGLSTGIPHHIPESILKILEDEED